MSTFCGRGHGARLFISVRRCYPINALDNARKWNRVSFQAREISFIKFCALRYRRCVSSAALVDNNANFRDVVAGAAGYSTIWRQPRLRAQRRRRFAAFAQSSCMKRPACVPAPATFRAAQLQVRARAFRAKPADTRKSRVYAI